MFPKDENGDEYWTGQSHIVTSGATDKVFVIADDGIFAFDSGSDKGRFISEREEVHGGTGSSV